MKGSYLLLLKNDKEQVIKVGALGKINFPPGYYLYVGSALNNLEKRIKRHKRKRKKKFWHIDYLTTKFQFLGTKEFPSTKKTECQIASRLKKRLFPLKGFGASDCSCPSHLFYFPNLFSDKKFILDKKEFSSILNVKMKRKIRGEQRRENLLMVYSIGEEI
ncbi:MAG: GIY-YIG nuclease family protein [candidate division WOR-3 bacterium]